MTRWIEDHAHARGAIFQAPLVAPQPTVERPSPLHLVGNTPLIRIARIPEIPPGVEIYAKAEWHNPGGSVKDRPALRMIEEAERSGALGKHKVILDATSGNTGIAYAMIAAVKGYRIELCIPENCSDERKKILAAYGAIVHYTSGLEGSDGAIREARRRLEADPERYYLPDQYNNPANWWAHRDTTGPEIHCQTNGRITDFVASLGTSGTVMGVGRYLKSVDPSIRVWALEPEPFHGIEGLKNMDVAIVPGIYDPSWLDGKIEVETEPAYKAVRALARREGLIVGQSSGAALTGALELARRIEKGVIVTIFPDGGEKYLTTSVWDAES